VQSAESSLVRIRDLLALGGKDFLIEVQKGNIAGHSMVHKFGRNDNVPMNSWEFINLLGFTDWPLSAPTTVRIKAGGDAADVAGGAANTAAVTVENSGGGTDVIQIGAGEGQTQFGGWTVSLGKSAYLMSLHMHVDSKKIANIRMFTREDIDDVVAPMKSKRLKLFFDGVIGNVPYRAKGPEIKIPQKTDIWLEAFGDAATAEVACDFELLVVDN